MWQGRAGAIVEEGAAGANGGDRAGGCAGGGGMRWGWGGDGVDGCDGVRVRVYVIRVQGVCIGYVYRECVQVVHTTCHDVTPKGLNCVDVYSVSVCTAC